MEGVPAYGHPPECQVTSGRGFHIVWYDPRADHRTSEEKFYTFLDVSLSDKLIGESYGPQNKTFRRGANSGLSDELCDKNDIETRIAGMLRRWDIAGQERKFVI